VPELPEVELVARSLNELVAKRQIVAAELLRSKLAPATTELDFANFFKGVQIESVSRRGKHVLFYFDSNKALITHLRMTGRFLLLPDSRDLPKHTHAVFYFADRFRLAFQDQRHFGMMKIIERDKLFETRELSCLAPEPLSDNFTFEYFKRVLQSSGRSLKEFLLDQSKVCGLGNIYAAEAMFLARVSPQKLANTISQKSAKRLFDAIRFVLAESIDHGSTMNVNPENIDGSYYEGNYERHWRVYDQADNPCATCQSLIKRIVQGQRSTFFCPRCQRH
jgi:formamidopyrimidine-DNA glycosylase